MLQFRSESGKDRLRMGLVKNTPALIFCDEDGNGRAALSVGKNAVSLVFYDGKENRKAWLVMSDEAAALHLRGREGQRHSGLSVEEDGIAAWRHDEAGSIRVAENAFKNVPGRSLHGEMVDPLHPGHD